MALPGVYKIFNERWCKQTVWCISDPHFGDEELRAGIPGRPTDEELVKLINSKVGKNDTLICLGDVGDPEFARKLRGYKVLVCGNHDRGASVYEEIFDEVYVGALMIGEKIILSHEPVNIPWAQNWHGHNHSGKHRPDNNHINFCADVINYTPVNINQLLKNGAGLNKIQSLERITIDKATERKQKRGGKKLGNKEN